MAVDSVQYKVNPCSMILQRVNFENLEHFGEISTKIKTILTHYSVAQAGSNYEKTGRKSRWTVPLNMIQNIQMTRPSMILRGAS